MKLKKILLLLPIMLFGLISTPISHSSDEIVVGNEKVNLRQKAKVRSANNEGANIETTNVDYDLRYLFGGAEGYRKFDINTLKPTSNDSKDTSFRFVCAKPVNEALYLYLYHVDNRNSEILSANFRISKSKTQNEDTGTFDEVFTNYNARFVNSYGYKQRFMKFAINGLINLEDDVRIYIDSGYITYRDKSNGKSYYSSNYSIQDEFAFKPGNNEDFMYQYFKNDYVKITDGEIGLMLTAPLDGETKYNEDFYYFFSTDHEISELIEIQYDYDFVTYEVKTELFEGANNYRYDNCYLGLLEDEESYKKYNPLEVEILSQELIPNVLAKKNTITEQVERPLFLWWTHKVNYKFESIQDCLDTKNLTGKEYEAFKEFIEDKQSERVNKNKSKYEWCVRLVSSKRELKKVTSEHPWYYYITSLGTKYYGFSECHEVRQGLITWMKFRTNNKTFEFNVLDIPKDTSSVYVQNVPYATLSDIVIENIVNMLNWIQSALNGVISNIVPLAIIILSIILLVICFPVITSITQLVGAGIRSTSNRIEKKFRKKKKGK